MANHAKLLTYIRSDWLGVTGGLGTRRTRRLVFVEATKFGSQHPVVAWGDKAATPGGGWRGLRPSGLIPGFFGKPRFRTFRQISPSDISQPAVGSTPVGASGGLTVCRMVVQFGLETIHVDSIHVDPDCGETSTAQRPAPGRKKREKNGNLRFSIS